MVMTLSQVTIIDLTSEVNHIRCHKPEPEPKPKTAAELISFLRQEVSGRAGVSQALDALAELVAHVSPGPIGFATDEDD